MERFIEFLLSILPFFYLILVMIVTQSYYKWRTKEKNTVLSSILLGLTVILFFTHIFAFELHGEFPYVQFILFVICSTSGIILITKPLEDKDIKDTIDEHIVQ